MESFSYVQEGGRNYLKSESVCEVDYIVGMFSHNDIPAFAPARFKSLNLENYICYNMNGLIPISQSFEMNKLTAERLEAFLRSLIRISKSMEEFLLPFDRLVTDESYIYESLNKRDEFYWIYGNERGNSRFTELFESLLDRVDYKDDRAVKMIYSLYQAAKESEDLLGGEAAGSSLYRIKEKAEEILSAPHTSLDVRAKELIRFENEKNSKDMRRNQAEKIPMEAGFTGKYQVGIDEIDKRKTYRYYAARQEDDIGSSKEMSDRDIMAGADSMARRYREKEEDKKRILREKVTETPKAKLSIFKKSQPGEKTDKATAVKSKLKKVWDYLNADIGSKPENLVELQTVEEDEITYNVREVRPPKQVVKEGVSEPTTLLTGALVRNGVYCLKPDDSSEENILLTEFPFFIGKAEENTHHTIEDSTVSRFHARIDKEEEELWLTDLNSTNGTFLNGIRLVPFGRMRMNKGDSVVISRKRYEIKYLV